MRFFGAGNLFGTVSGVANPTPLQFGVLQEVSLDISFSSKELYGQNQFPVDIGRGSAKISGKAKLGDLDPEIFAQLFFDTTTSVGQILGAINEAGVVPTTPFQVTVVNSATWTVDDGVYYAATGVRLKRVAAAPAVGEYIVAAGVYTFNTGDQGSAVLISYQYTSATGGKKFTMINNLLGDAPTFSLTFMGQRVVNAVTRKATINLNRCMSSKLAIATKTEDFLIPEFDFMAMADDSGNIGTMSFTN